MQTLKPTTKIERSGTDLRQCVGCGAPIASLYTEYSKGNIRLTQCNACGSFADKYIENDVVIVFIDMILQKRPVYRHLLRNRLVYDEWGLNVDILKLAILLVLFEVCDWKRLTIEKTFFTSETSVSSQYLYILAICAFEPVFGCTKKPHNLSFCKVFFFISLILESYNRISIALIVSSFGKLLLILMVIWDYNELEYAWLVNVLVLISNLEALSGTTCLFEHISDTDYTLISLHRDALYPHMPFLAGGLLMRIGIELFVRSLDPNMIIMIL
ncbi:Arv1-like family-domain-containing protein [Chytridium lagenaria]|nr:Arv1-like family-domain-containing protein [Chytridium lagenaria]